MVRKQVGNRFGELKFIAHADHNHHGPDTSGTDPLRPINDKFFEYMLNIMVKTTVEALQNEQPSILLYGEREWAFGMRKNRDPRIMDKGLRVLQAKSLDGRQHVIATIVQWTNHPEVTLGFNPRVPLEHCTAIGEPSGCSANGRYLSSDYVGVMQRLLKKEFGCDVNFLNGALGVLTAPLYANVWEPSERFPITGDGEQMPNGAVNIEKNFRRTELIGTELAKAISSLIKAPEMMKPLSPKEFVYKKEEFFTRTHNLKFRLGMANLKPGNRSLLGFSPRRAYICTNHDAPSSVNCVDDGFRNSPSGVPGIVLRLGEYAKTETVFVDFGPLKWLTTPGEMPPELFLGLPSDFYTNTSKYYLNPRTHAYGDKYVIPGFGKDIIGCNKENSCWIIGLGGDELGYFVPISDFRYKCMYPEPTCKRLPMEHKEALAFSGEDCRFVIEAREEARRRFGEVDFMLIEWNCVYGLIEQAQNHYEETNSLGFHLVRDYINSVKRIALKDNSSK